MRLILLFIGIPLIELVLLMEIGSHIGTLNTIMVVVVTGIMGALMTRSAGLQVLSKIQESLRAGIVPQDELFDGILILGGGLLLLTPGLLTDGVGFFLLVPFGRSVVKGWLREVVKQKVERGELTWRGNSW